MLYFITFFHMLLLTYSILARMSSHKRDTDVSQITLLCAFMCRLTRHGYTNLYFKPTRVPLGTNADFLDEVQRAASVSNRSLRRPILVVKHDSLCFLLEKSKTQTLFSYAASKCIPDWYVTEPKQSCAVNQLWQQLEKQRVICWCFTHWADVHETQWCPVFSPKLWILLTLKFFHTCRVRAQTSVSVDVTTSRIAILQFPMCVCVYPLSISVFLVHFPRVCWNSGMVLINKAGRHIKVTGLTMKQNTRLCAL